MKNQVITIAVMIWASITFLALIAEAETLTALIILKAFAFSSAIICIKVCRDLEKRGVFKIEDDSVRF